MLRTTLVDLVVSEIDLPDMNGLRFYRLLQQATNTDPAPLKDLVIPCDSDQ